METGHIRERMRAIRQKKAESASRLEVAVTRMKDWREHVGAHPWLASTLMLVAAYSLVPNRNARTRPGAVSPAPEQKAVPVTSELGRAALNGLTSVLLRLATQSAVSLFENFRNGGGSNDGSAPGKRTGTAGQSETNSAASGR